VGLPPPLAVEVRPPSPYRLGRGSSDRTLRVAGGVAYRLLHVECSPILVRAWQPGADRVCLRADALDPAAVRVPVECEEVSPATPAKLATAVARMRFAIGVDEDMAPFQRRFRDDPLIGPLVHRLPAFRPGRNLWPWEALVTAICKQLIEASRASVIERRIVGRWGPRTGEGRNAFRDVPSPAAIAGRAPAELQGMDLSGARALALRRVARAIAGGKLDPGSPDSDRRLLSTPEIGPWTVQCLGLFGRGDMDSLPAGDLGYIKLVGRLAGLDRRATIPEVEAFYAPYEPYRGLVGALTLSGLHHLVAQGPPLRIVPDLAA
jgi:3-methyladenine DNA glycosylase/8-oxoguanine DNA glycosylase